MTDPHPSQPRAILRQLEQRARRRFGQHFLTDTHLVRRMVRAAQVQPGDRVVEVGPGLGILTEALLDAGADLTCVELDRDLAAWLKERHPDLRLIEGDALAVDWSEVAPGEGWRVVANLPYNVGTHLTMALVRAWPRFRSITVMLQLEVVQRFLAEPGSKAYNALSVELQARARPLFLMTVEPGAFHPPPKVRSAVVRLDLLGPAQVGEVTPERFDEVVRAAFAHRRKTLLNSLGARYGKELARGALSEAGIDPGLRAQVLDQGAFQTLALAVDRLLR